MIRAGQRRAATTQNYINLAVMVLFSLLSFFSSLISCGVSVCFTPLPCLASSACSAVTCLIQAFVVSSLSSPNLQTAS
ncbi:hypothetical protein AUEXF2481DRAFT_387166 [Aureobasidium subglaciale EXF-2481]|uniref:Uncharacterized protein n=1 Tax=Aureobasidium subglaciale (strain EXF-2481) TaxID=1043005 RepID=A0A074YXQ8_AURSE|nr:uncharacterized protein AUEXF2481DRAFT_387166 [Aureobasidium subglaciale EXF-2481]KEQ98972.1 hypothetical protein AUEXF2481DRAFT_387166 [Aureobasidium subglaciale EXF-2481]